MTNPSGLSANRNSRLLHLGCGLQAPAAWLNVDSSLQAAFAQRPILKRLLVALGIYPRRQAGIAWPANVLRLDLRSRLPFPDDQFDAVYSSHTLEHLYHEDARHVVCESFRLLRRGGVARFVVPDLGALIDRYQKNAADGDAEASHRFMDALNVYPATPERGWLGLYHRLLGYHQHKWMYDAASLKQLMANAGFTEITHPACRTGRLPRVEEIEDPSRVLNGAGIIAEGIKPLTAAS